MGVLLWQLMGPSMGHCTEPERGVYGGDGAGGSRSRSRSRGNCELPRASAVCQKKVPAKANNEINDGDIVLS